MGVKMRQMVEREISEAIVDALLKAGFEIGVDNGDNSGRDFELPNSVDRKRIFKAMFLTDEDRLYAIKNKQHVGWVYLVYGNDGWDVLSDYTVNLEPYIGDKSPVQKIIDKYAD
jgi:hypothetical protein